jgi:HAD superfamily hydrolase (TIGR01549 family)
MGTIIEKRKASCRCLSGSDLNHKMLTKDHFAYKSCAMPSCDMVVVLFDLEGTLVKSIEDDKVAGREFKEKTENKLLKLGIPKCELEGLTTSSIMLNKAQEVVEKCFDERKTGQFQSEMDRFLKRYELRWANLSQIFPDTLSALQKLRKHGFKMGIVTNTSKEAAGQMLAMHRIESFFEVVITRDEIKKLKPEPEGIQLALRRLNAKDFFFVGDSVHDIEATEKAGGISIMVNRCPSKMLKLNPNYVIDSLLEVPKLILDLRDKHSHGNETTKVGDTHSK